MPPRARSRCSTRSSATCRSPDRRRRPARGLGLVEGRRAPAPDLPRARRAGAGAGPRQGPRGAQGAAAGRSSPRRWPRSPPTRPPPDGRRGPSATVPAEQTWRRAGPRGPWLPGARRRGHHGRAAGLRVGRGGRRAAPAGVARLLLLALPRPDVLAGLDNATKLGLAGSPYGSVADLVEDVRRAVVLAEVDAPGGGPRRAGVRRAAGRPASRPRATDARAARHGRPGAGPLARRPTGRSPAGPTWPCSPRSTDMRDQLGRLVHRGFVGEAGPERLRRYPVYLAALDQRRARLDEQPARDQQLLAQVADLQAAYLHQVDALPAGRPPSARAARGAVAARGVPGLAVGAAARHGAEGQRPAHPQGTGRRGRRDVACAT